MKVEIKTKYTEFKKHKGKTFSEPSRAIQSARDGTFIESYLRKYRITGVLGDPTRRSLATYGDFSSMPDFQAAQNRVAQTTQFFQSLPSDIRKRFGNDVSTFVEYASNPDHIQEMVDLGIFMKPEGGLNVPQKQENTGISEEIQPSAPIEKSEASKVVPNPS